MWIRAPTQIELNLIYRCHSTATPHLIKIVGIHPMMTAVTAPIAPTSMWKAYTAHIGIQRVPSSHLAQSLFRARRYGQNKRGEVVVVLSSTSQTSTRKLMCGPRTTKTGCPPIDNLWWWKWPASTRINPIPFI